MREVRVANENRKSGERDLGEGREGNEIICTYTISDLFITQTRFIHLCLYKKQKRRVRLPPNESGQRDSTKESGENSYSLL